MPASPNDLDLRLSVHEAVCAERYQTLLGRMGRIEKIIIAVSGALMVGMAGLVAKLLAVVGGAGGI
jgi:hypothetical protein